MLYKNPGIFDGPVFTTCLLRKQGTVAACALQPVTRLPAVTAHRPKTGNGNRTRLSYRVTPIPAVRDGASEGPRARPIFRRGRDAGGGQEQTGEQDQLDRCRGRAAATGAGGGIRRGVGSRIFLQVRRRGCPPARLPSPPRPPPRSSPSPNAGVEPAAARDVGSLSSRRVS